LVHGFLCSRAQWQFNLDALAEVCQPVTIELLGHNHSYAPRTPEPYLPEGYVNAFERIRTTLGVERWFVFGYSLGGGLTLRYAITHPEQVIGHGFSNSTSALADDDQLASWRAGAQASANNIISGGRAAIERIPVHPKHAKGLPLPLYEALLADAQRHSPLGIANTVRYTNSNASVRNLIANNRRPVLLAWGTKERRFQPYAEFAVKNLPNLTVEKLAAGHGVNMESHEAFNRALVRFIQQCPAS